MNVQPINFSPSGSVDGLSAKSSSPAKVQQSFAKTFEQAFSTVNESQQKANEMVTSLANGTSGEDLHNIMIAIQEANTLLRTTVQVRDRVIEGYQEIMRMQV